MDLPFYGEQDSRTDSKMLNSEMEFFQLANGFVGYDSPPPPSLSPPRVRFEDPISQLSNDPAMDAYQRNINILSSPSGNGSSSGYESGLYELILSAKLTLLRSS